MEMEQSGENTEMRTKKNVGQKLVTEKRKTKNPLRCNGFFVYMINSDYSHSMVPMGLGVRSYRTRLMPSTSWVMRSTILCRTA